MNDADAYLLHKLILIASEVVNYDDIFVSIAYSPDFTGSLD